MKTTITRYRTRRKVKTKIKQTKYNSATKRVSRQLKKTIRTTKRGKIIRKRVTFKEC